MLDTYLGEAAGKQVLRGSIKRGAGEAIRAIIWVSDLRGFTDLSDRLAGSDIVALINAYFERLAGAVMAEGGEVLKFIGDGLLAVFPYAHFKNGRAAAQASLAAAEHALRAVDDLTAQRRRNSRPSMVAAAAEWNRAARGEVFFGNVGAPDRLDFTVIGSAVNTASRVEALTKSLDRPVLITEPVARMLDCPLDHLGEYTLRGLATPLAIFSPGASVRG